MSALDYRLDNPRILEYAGGYTNRIRYGANEANSQTFKAGQFVYLNSGAVTVSATDAANSCGIAMKDATNVTSGNIEIPYEEVYPGDVIAIRVTNNGTDALASTLTRGTLYGLYVASNTCYLDANDTSNDRFAFIDILDVGDGKAASYWAVARVLDDFAQMFDSD